MGREGFLEEVTSESRSWEAVGRQVPSRGSSRNNGLEVRVSLTNSSSYQMLPLTMSPPTQGTALRGEGLTDLFLLLRLFALFSMDPSSSRTAWHVIGFIITMHAC